MMTSREIRRGAVRALIATLHLLLLLCAHRLDAAADDTTVTIFDRRPVDSPRRVITSRVMLPDASRHYEKITLTYGLDCPRGGCDPWDRGSQIWIADRSADTGALDDFRHYFFTARKYEISRFVTPYGKGGKWTVDITDYRPLLTDSATFVVYITTFTGNGSGYLLSMTAEFVAGDPDVEAYRIENLWQGSPEYGNPQNPIESFLAPITVTADREVDFAKVRIVSTGHGQGNTDNAGEFARKRHELTVDRTARFEHYLWRDDCGGRLGLQYGTWEESRAGFCPGDVVFPWDNDITEYIVPGKSFALDYDIEPYENRCRPGVEPCPCKDCDYNELDHTKPIFHIESHILFYRVVHRPEDDWLKRRMGVSRADKGGRSFVFTPDLPEPTDLEISLRDAHGNIVFRQKRKGVKNTRFTVDLSSTPGIFVLKVAAGEREFRTRIEAL